MFHHSRLRCSRSPSVATWLLFSALASAQTNDDWQAPTAEPWPAADELFRRDPRWRGGDGASSIDLGGGRVLWLFGDSFVSNSVVNNRKETRLINNSVGIQQGYDPVQASLTCYWNSDGAQPAAFFKSDSDTWFWPAGGVIVDDRLLILLMEIRKADTGMGFAFVGSAGLLVENPNEPPNQWQTQPVVMPDRRFQMIYGSGGLDIDGQHLYAISPVASLGHHAYLLRWQLPEVRRCDLSQPQWYNDGHWTPGEQLKELPSPTIPLAQTEFTIHYDTRRNGFLQVQCSPFDAGQIGIRFARQRQGPWSSLRSVFDPHKNSHNASGTFYYAAKLHPELDANGLTLTYCSNAKILGNVIDDESIYYPRFLRLRP